LAKAELKTGLFKWSPNYVQAAIHYEKAAKLYKQAGNKANAIDAYLQFSKCSEQSNELLGAAEGLNEAAFLTDDRKKSLQWLAEADTFYKIAGQNERGLTQMKKVAQDLLDKETPEADQEALKIFKNLFEMVFTNDNYLFNADIIDTYYKL
jgi:Soluble NSF attachment protein, SNAP